MPVEQALDVGLGGEVGCHDRRVSELGRERTRPLLAAVVMDQDARAFGCKGASARCADPAGGTGDDNALALKPRVRAA